MYNSNTDSLGLILGEEVFFLLVTVQEHCEPNFNLQYTMLLPRPITISVR